MYYVTKDRTRVFGVDFFGEPKTAEKAPCAEEFAHVGEEKIGIVADFGRFTSACIGWARRNGVVCIVDDEVDHNDRGLTVEDITFDSLRMEAEEGEALADRMLGIAEDGAYETFEEAPHIAFYYPTSKGFAGIDNTTGDCWVEEFDTEEEAIAWCKGEDV